MSHLRRKARRVVAVGPRRELLPHLPPAGDECQDLSEVGESKLAKSGFRRAWIQATLD